MLNQAFQSASDDINNDQSNQSLQRQDVNNNSKKSFSNIFPLLNMHKYRRFDNDHVPDNDDSEKTGTDVPRSVIEPVQETTVQFFRNSNKSNRRRLKFYQIYRYSDKWDIFLMFIGTIAATIIGAFFPAMLYLYQDATNNLINLGKLQANLSQSNIVLSTAGECFIIPNSNTTTQSSYNAILSIIKYYILLGVLTLFLCWLAWACWILVAERQIRRIRYALFQNILRQEIEWFDIHSPGELTNYFIEDLDKIKNGINDKVPDFISLVARIVTTLIYTFILGWKMTLVFLSVAPLIIITSNMIIKIIETYTTKEIHAFASASSIAQEVLRNIQTVTAFHGQKKEEERFAENLIAVKKVGIKKGLYMGICQCLIQVFTFVGYAVTTWYGIELYRTDCQNYPAGTVFAVFLGCLTAIASMTQIVPNLQNFAEALASGGHIFEIIDRQTKIDAMSEEGDKPEIIHGDIEFDNVIFTYPTRQTAPILNKLSLKIPSSKTVALVGASRCGKSTIIKLIQRFYDPTEGRILLDGKDIKTLNVGWLRSRIGVVSQEPVLFNGTIEDNIRLGKPDATDDEIQSAAKIANAHDFIMALKENYKTLAGDRLSGGQKQRVAIARALISNPKILLLDEATSALDNTSERVVQDALDRAKQGRTTIIIAHRLSTIRNADLIISLADGCVIEYGTHDDLMKQDGLYYELVTAQIQKEEEEEVNSDSDQQNDDTNVLHRKYSQQSSTCINYSDEIDNNDEKTKFGDDLSKSRNEHFYRPSASEILRLNAPEWPWILMGTFCSLIYGTIQPIFAFMMSKIYGLTANPNLDEQKHLIRFYAIVVFLMGVVSGVTQLLSTIGFAKSGEELTMRMRKLTFSAILRQEMNYFDEEINSVGALVTRLSSDASALKGMTGVRIGILMQTLITLIAALVIAFSSGWKLTLVALCFIPLMLFSGMLQGKGQTRRDQTKFKGSFAEQGGQYATQAFEHIHTVVALHQENYFLHLYRNAFDQEFKHVICRLHLVAIGAGIANSLLYFIYTASFLYGSRLVLNGEMPFDHVYRVFVVITFAMMSIGRSMAIIPDYSKAKQAALQIMQLNKRKSKINPHDESGIVLKEITGNIEFYHVDFHYPTRSTVDVLRNFSLQCSVDGTTALVGPSGNGKSTIIRLLQRFYDPIKGIILLDGHDIKVLNLRWLRSLMGLVQQEPVLFNVSIRDNIAYGDNSRQVTQNEIEDAAKMANIHQSIISLPQGYDTLCGIKGSHLSGGEKQRIAIARALVRSPKILLFDEATSALDTKNEKIVQAALDRTRSGRTCLTVAHRLSTIQNSDKIAVVDRGTIVEEGTHNELLRLNGIYARLAVAQQRST